MTILNGLPSRYRILNPLGHGGLGNVYRVFDSLSERELALKLFSASHAVSKNFLTREFNILSKLNHPNLVRVHDLGFTTDNTPFFTMDLVEGITINSFFEESSNDLYLVEILRSTLSALQYLHGKKIFHGDIKPDNIIISNFPQTYMHVTLLDFGLAVIQPVGGGKVSGTLTFIAPELLSGGEYTTSSDLFSLGMTLIRSLTKIEIPLPGMLDDEFLRQAYTLLERRLSSSNVSNPSSIASLIISLCHPERFLRPGDVEECMKLLPSIKLEKIPNPVHFENIFVNRQVELVKFNSILNPSNSTGNTILMRGKTGIGKKSLLKKALATAQLRNYLTVDFSSQRYNTDSLNCFIKLLGGNLTEESKSNLIRSHNDILKSLDSVGTIDAPSTRENRSKLIYDNIVRYIHDQSVARPMLISIPDIQRFGVDFLEFINHLVYETELLRSKVWILLSINTDSAQTKAKSSKIKSLISISSLTEMDIRQFSKDETALFIAEAFGSRVFFEHQIEIIHKVTAGVPLLLSRLFQHYISLDILQWDGSAWNLDHDLFNKYKAPDTLGGMIDTFLKNLNHRKRTIIETLSLFREPVQINEFILLFDSNKDIPGEIKYFVENNIVDIDNGYLDFSNPLLRQIVLKNLPTGRRTIINLNIAHFMILNHPERCVEITRYLLETKETDECIRYGADALSLLTINHQYHEISDLATSLYNLAKTSGSLSQELHFLKILAHAEVMIGAIKDAAVHFIHLAEQSNNPSDKSLFYKEAGIVKEYHLSDREGAEKDYDLALQYSKDSGDIQLEAEILIFQGYSLKSTNYIQLLEKSASLSKNVNSDLYAHAISIMIYMSQLNGNIEQMNRYINELRSLLDSHQLNIASQKRAFHVLHLASFFQGDYSTARYYVRNKIDLSKTTMNELENIINLKSLGGLLFIEGKYPQMIDTLNEALSLAKRFGVTTSIILILENLSGVYRILGNYEYALNVLKEAELLISHSTVRNVNIMIYLKPLSLYIQLGDYFSSEIEHYSRKLREKAQRNSDQIMLGHRQLSLSRHHYQKFAFGKSITCALKALSHFSSSNDRDDIVDSLSHLAIYEIEKGDLENATGHVKEARKIFDEIHCEYLRPFLLFAEGTVARARGEAAAEGILENALATSKKMGTREITWQIQRQLALLFLDSDDIQTAAAYYRDSMESIKQITESIPDDAIKMSYLSLPFRKRVFDEIKKLRST